MQILAKKCVFTLEFGDNMWYYKMKYTVKYYCKFQKGQVLMNIKCAFVSLGCPKNLLDSEVMLAKLNANKIEIVPEDIDADVVVVNTCAFIDSAKQEAIDTILDVAWLRENRHLKGIVVTGCLAQRYKDEIFKQMPEVDAVVGVGDIDKIVEAVEYAYHNGAKKDVPKYICVTNPENASLGGDRVVTTPEYSTYIKISEGCDNRCTYCIIPYLRGKFRSRTIEDVVNEAKEMASMGAREIILVSQDTTRYGTDLYGKPSLDKLLKEICKIESIKWVRILYCYPEEITDELVETMANEPKVVKYIDLPIQHISDKILKAMNRRGNGQLIKEKIALLRQKVPGIVIRSTVIVGFPGETKEDFACLAEFLKQVKFERLGVFAFSCQEGTPAAKIKDGIVPEKTKQKRLDTLMQHQFDVHESFNQGKVGKVLEVLCEGFDKASGVYFGRSEFDAPEIDGKVYFSSKDRKISEGEFVNVKIEQVLDYDLLGQVVL